MALARMAVAHHDADDVAIALCAPWGHRGIWRRWSEAKAALGECGELLDLPADGVASLNIPSLANRLAAKYRLGGYDPRLPDIMQELRGLLQCWSPDGLAVENRDAGAGYAAVAGILVEHDPWSPSQVALRCHLGFHDYPYQVVAPLTFDDRGGSPALRMRSSSGYRWLHTGSWLRASGLSDDALPLPHVDFRSAEDTIGRPIHATLRWQSGVGSPPSQGALCFFASDEPVLVDALPTVNPRLDVIREYFETHAARVGGLPAAVAPDRWQDDVGEDALNLHKPYGWMPPRPVEFVLTFCPEIVAEQTEFLNDDELHEYLETVGFASPCTSSTTSYRLRSGGGSSTAPCMTSGPMPWRSSTWSRCERWMLRGRRNREHPWLVCSSGSTGARAPSRLDQALVGARVAVCSRRLGEPCGRWGSVTLGRIAQSDPTVERTLVSTMYRDRTRGRVHVLKAICAPSPEQQVVDGANAISDLRFEGGP
jgi:hypothetical protein